MSERLYSPAVIRAVMERHHLRFTKALGQNFLIDGNLVHKIIETAEVQPGDVVLLSPACASFDRFKKFMERGAAFKRSIYGLE